MKKGHIGIVIFCVGITALIMASALTCNAQFPIVTLVPQPPILPYVGDTITAFDSFLWPAGATLPATTLAAISYPVPGAFSTYPGLVDPQVYLTNSWGAYLTYLNLYFTAAGLGSTLPGAFGPFDVQSVNTWATLGYTYPFFTLPGLVTLLAYYTSNPISASFVSAYPLIY